METPDKNLEHPVCETCAKRPDDVAYCPCGRGGDDDLDFGSPKEAGK